MTQRYTAGTRGMCPHCRTTVRFERHPNFYKQLHCEGDELRFAEGRLERDEDEERMFALCGAVCPECGQSIVSIETFEGSDPLEDPGDQELTDVRLIWPMASARPPLPMSVPRHLHSEYYEAALVLGLSQKASAALSRRCLQLLLREAGSTKSKDLAAQIEEILPTLPGYLQSQLDAVRNIGNFATHPAKSKSTGEIVDVEPGEAEWTLDVLEMLFDFYYEQPKIAQQKRDALNKKLTDASKPPMK